MPYSALRQQPDGTWVYPVDALIAKLRRYLATLIPYRELYYNRSNGGLFVKAIDTNTLDRNNVMHGPYYYVHLVALGRMINVWHGMDRDKPSITVYDRTGVKYMEQALPKHLQFAVVTPALAAMVTQLRREGYTVTPPTYAPAQGLIAEPPVTLPVTVVPVPVPLLAPAHDPTDDELDDSVIEALMNGQPLPDPGAASAR